MIKLPQFQPKLAVVGRIKNGLIVPVTNAKGEPVHYDDGRPKTRPKQIDHYLVTTNLRDEYGNFVVDTDVMEKLRAAPGIADTDGLIRRIPVMVHSDDLESVFPTRLVAYEGKGLACTGDGEHAKRWKVERGAQVGEPVELACPCEWLETGKCKGNGILRVSIMLPDVITLGSVYEYRTTSVIGIPRIQGGLMHVQSEIGTLVGTPMWLVLRPEQVSPPGQAPKTVYTSFLHLRGSDLVQLQQSALARVAAAKQVQAIAGRHVLLGLPAPSEETEHEEIVAEFYEREEAPKAGRDYDAKTGEVFDAPREEPKPVVKPGAERMNPAGTPSPVAKPAEEQILPKEDPLRREIAERLKELADLRGVEPADMAQARKEILAEVTAQECGFAIVFGSLTPTSGFKVTQALKLMILKKTADNKAEQESDEIPESP